MARTATNNVLWEYAVQNDSYDRFAEFYADVTDEQLVKFNVTWSENQRSAYDAEVAKRRAKAQREQATARERARLVEERATIVHRQKDALTFSDRLATEICERIRAGELLTVICLDEHLPTVKHVSAWLKQYPEFRMLYDDALRDRLHVFAEDLVRIPDEAARDFDLVSDKNGTTRRVLDPARITAAKLRVAVRRLHLVAGNPQKWGDVSTLNVKSEDPFDPANLNDAELEARISEIERKDATIKGRRVA
jgi:hypothetical protein